jgi:hypothetical protein
MHRRTSLTWLLSLLLISSACVSTEESGDGIVGGDIDANGKSVFETSGWVEAQGSKDDSITGRRGLPVSVDTYSTAVWSVRNQWDESETPEARQAGMAWEANSGLNWDEKYQAWIEKMRPVAKTSGWGDTFELITPWGFNLPAPALECAETSIFLRIAFSNWYGLPFFLEGRDGDRKRLYFGHFGMRTSAGKYGRTPTYRTRYEDHTQKADSVRDGGSWPTDTGLAGKKIAGSFDDAQPMIGPNAHAGAYMDRIFLNKRAGHFMLTTLAYFGSMNLADSANTFNVVPENIRPGDSLVERWQRSGIGHVLVTMHVAQFESTVVDGEQVPQIEAELASGSMPRRQPVWDSSGASKRYYVMDETGGPGYEDFGGGLKRWRTAKNVSGQWTNVVMPGYRSEWINSNDKDTLMARPARFEKILVQLTPEQRRQVLLEVIEAKRRHLQNFPASCSARINREKAFDALYELGEAELGLTKGQLDAQYRRLEDYVFAELDYPQSKTCCWNSSTSQMYDIAMNYNLEQQENSSQCIAPVVFKNRDDSGDGFELFRSYAQENGRGDQWVTWRADESCPQADVAADTEVDHEWVGYCDLSNPPTDNPSNNSDNNSNGGNSNSGTYPLSAVAIPDDEEEGVVTRLEVTQEGELDSVSLAVDIEHSYRGDLDIRVIHPDGTEAHLKDTGWDWRDDLNETYTIDAFRGKEARGTWTVKISDRAASDEGEIVSGHLSVRVQ